MKLKLTKTPTYYIEEEGLIANFDFAEGRMIPALVLSNEKGDKAVEDLIKLHLDTPPGDVTVVWSRPLMPLLKSEVWQLNLKFTQPFECEFLIEFNLEKYHTIIDAIYLSRGLYISYGNKGDKVSQLKNGAVLIEVPNTGTDDIWERKLKEVVFQKIKKKYKLPKHEIRRLVKATIDETRNLINFQKKL